MKVRVEHTFNLSDHDIEMAREAYAEYALPDETFREYVRSNLISEGVSWLQSLADQGYGNE